MEDTEDRGLSLEKPRKKGRPKRAVHAGGYNRKLTANAAQQEEAKRNAYMAAMRAHFEEVSLMFL